MTLALICSLSISAFASTKNFNQSVNEFAKAAYSGQAADINSLNALSFNFENAAISLPAANDNVVKVTNRIDEADDFSFAVSLPMENNKMNLADNTIFYQNANEDYLQAVQIEEADIHVITEVLNEKAPTEFVYGLNLPAGTTMEKTDDNVIYIYDENGMIRALVVADGTVDANGNAIDTSLEITAAGIVQSLQPNDKMAFPVDSGISVMSVHSFGYYFTKGEWLNRSDGITLELTPYFTNLYSGGTLPDNVTRKDDSWSTVYNNFYTSSNWKNTASMKSQYMCHYNLSVGTDAWNLEPWRTGEATFSNHCNP